MGRANVQRAEDLLRRGRFQAAVDAFRQLLSSDPENAVLRGRVAEAYRRASNPERALHHFRKAAALFAQDQDVLGAVRMLEAADHVSPGSPDVLFRLAEHFKQLGRERAFVATARRLAAVAKATGDRRRLWALEELAHARPHDLSTRLEWARALSEARKVSEAVLVCRELGSKLSAEEVMSVFAPFVEKPPDEAAVATPIAELFLDHGLAREALAVLIPAYSRASDHVGILATLVKVLTLLGDTARALAARLELVKAYARAGQRPETVDEVQALLEEAPVDPTALEICGHAYASLGLGQEAARVWFRLAELHDKHGQTQERNQIVRMILKQAPSHPGALAITHSWPTIILEDDDVVEEREHAVSSVVDIPEIEGSDGWPFSAGDDPPTIRTKTPLPATDATDPEWDGFDVTGS